MYYLDPATPTKWRPYFKQGIEDWNTAFEKAGFKNAIQAKEPPTAEEDPDFSPEDIRYSTVRYVASTTRNAVGPVFLILELAKLLKVISFGTTITFAHTEIDIC